MCRSVRVVAQTGPVADVSFVGGMNVPGKPGRASATMPLARLTVSDGHVSIRPRVGSSLLASFEVPIDQVTAAFPLRGRILTAGIGLTTRNEATAYFWTWRGPLVLDALRAQGVNVETARRRPAKMWWSS